MLLDGRQKLVLGDPALLPGLEPVQPRLRQGAELVEELLPSPLQHLQGLRIDPLEGGHAPVPREDLPQGPGVAREVAVLERQGEVAEGDGAAQLRVHCISPSGHGGAMLHLQAIPKIWQQGLPCFDGFLRLFVRGEGTFVSRLFQVRLVVFVTGDAEGLPGRGVGDGALGRAEGGLLPVLALARGLRVEIPDCQQKLASCRLQTPEQLLGVVAVAKLLASLRQHLLIDRLIRILAEAQPPSLVQGAVR
mmetsp:Transcript_90726/g.292863  ORF Transcript_90726/g.292863 Transcript_90726/m.292863 type:complete len:248 (-) Transcript_90726:2236-2979(-)